MADDALSLPHGTVDLLLLKTLSWGPMHGYAVSRWVRERTEGTLAIDDAALYQGLHRLERRGWIRAEWGQSANNRRARFYVLTAGGRQQLRRESALWRRYVEALTRVLEARTAEG